MPGISFQASTTTTADQTVANIAYIPDAVAIDKSKAYSTDHTQADVGDTDLAIWQMHASYEDAFHSVFGGNETGQTLGAFVLLLVPVVEFEAVFDGGVDTDVGPFV